MKKYSILEIPSLTRNAPTTKERPKPGPLPPKNKSKETIITITISSPN